MARKKTTARKASTKVKKAAKRAAAPKTAMKKMAVPSVKVGKDPLKKSQIYTYIAESVGQSRKDVSEVFETLGKLMDEHLKKTGPGEFILPGLLKCRVQRKPATKARKGINPFTGEEMMFKAKPARNVVKIRPLKKLKEMVQ